MAEKLAIYKCEVCGNIVELIHVGGGELVCCGQPMVEEAAKKEDTGSEKHVPVIEKFDGGYKVKVGSAEHPMEEQHYIEWIELIADGCVYKQYLAPGQSPEAVFNIESDIVSAREYCSVHGLWKG